MRKTFILPFILTVLIVRAQTPYELFNSKSEFFFNQSDFNAELVGLRPDSVKVNGTDSVYYHYRILGYYPTSGSCINAKAPSWFGFKTVRRANNDYVFYNKDTDTLLIKASAPLNAQWIFYTFPNGDFIKANVSSISYSSTYDGMSDTVKTISFQAYNSSSVSISHQYNSVTYKIARTQGMIRCGDIYNFPSFIGIHTRCFGKRLTNGDNYDFNIGDILQTQFQGYAQTSTNVHTTYTYTAKTTPSANTIVYTANVYKHQVNTSAQSSTTTISNTVETMTINNVNTLKYSQMPGQFTGTNTPFYSGFKLRYFFNSLTGNKNCNFYIQTNDCFEAAGNNDTCMSPSVSCQTYSFKNHYYKLGTYGNQNSSPFNPVTIVYKPIYVASSTYTCGAYILAGMNEQSEFSEEIKVQPVPANDHIVVSSEVQFSQGEILIKDVLGKTIITKKEYLTSPIDISELKPGVYFLQLKTDKGETVKKFIKE